MLMNSLIVKYLAIVICLLPKSFTNTRFYCINICNILQATLRFCSYFVFSICYGLHPTIYILIIFISSVLLLSTFVTVFVSHLIFSPSKDSRVISGTVNTGTISSLEPTKFLWRISNPLIFENRNE